MITAVVIAYLLEGSVALLVRAGLSRALAAALVSLLFLGALLGLLLFLAGRGKTSLRSALSSAEA